ncbi:MAG: LLM class flavin-dependent oxidoreductase [Thaumarchaeota archaeon]|nr:LLM class flavin-dependent oxidoreductase [Nitrososphaerota archaeon]MCL5317736.1 LLM class flavin-dependent oxidoreductase [Nitrososphaerota archaeon]
MRSRSRTQILFSVELGPRGTTPDYETVKTICLEAERLGYYAFYLPDGVQWTGFECWTTLAHLAASTSTIRLGPAATFFTYRHPTLLAKTASTLDYLSNGRLELRLGAGSASAKIDHEHSGISQPDPKTRVAMLNEGLKLIKRLWSEPKVTYEGKYYTTNDAECWPKPLQKPHPPITVCANSQKTMRIAAQQADTWETTGGLDEYRRKKDFFKTCCQTIHQDFNSIRKSLEVNIAVAENNQEAEEIVRKQRSTHRVAPDSAYDPLRDAIIGRPDRCADALSNLVRVGISSFDIYFIGTNYLKSLRLFARGVVPILRDPDN